jgi:hypothetical protein
MKPDQTDQGANPRAGQRCHWSAEEKRRIGAESFRLGVRVQGGARYGLNANPVVHVAAAGGDKCRGRRGEEPVKLLPVTVAAAGTPAAPAAASEPVSWLEIVLIGG